MQEKLEKDLKYLTYFATFLQMLTLKTHRYIKHLGRKYIIDEDSKVKWHIYKVLPHSIVKALRISYRFLQKEGQR